jgi:hypothetical protein
VTRAGWIRAAQAAVTLLVLGFVFRALRAQWGEFRSVQLTVRLAPAWIALSVLIVLSTYLIQIESWRRVLAGWGQHLPYRSAARIWCLANLGRYVPGKIWTVAGMVVMVQRAGVESWAAAGSAVVMQALAFATGALAATLALPAAEFGPRLAVGLAVALGLLLAMGSAKVMRLANRFLSGVTLRPLPPLALLSGGALMFAGWLGYGLAFWALGRGLGAPPLAIPVAVSVFAAGYLLGWIAIVLPAGVGVREGVFLQLLRPLIGAGGAVVLSVGSRLVLTLTELGAAALAAGLTGPAAPGSGKRR